MFFDPKSQNSVTDRHSLTPRHVDRRFWIRAVLLLNLLIGSILSCSFSPPRTAIPESSFPQSESIELLAPPYTIGIFPFESHLSVSQWDWLGQGFTDMLTTDLAVWPGVEIVSRQLLGEVLREQWIQQRASSNDNDAVRLGQILGARYLVKGTVYPLDSGLSAEVHILDVESGSVAKTVRVRGSLDEIPTLVRRLAQDIGKLFDSQGSPIVKPRLNSPGPKLQNGKWREDDRRTASRSVPPQNLREEAQSHVLASDVLLRLDRRERLRTEAWFYAEELWQRGLATELNAPDFSSIKNERSRVGDTEEYLWVPVSSSFLPDKLEGIHPSLHVSVSSANEKHKKGILVWDGGDIEAGRLFSERVQAPRRLFIRAISKSGEVVSVSSQGSWRVDRLIEAKPDGSVEVVVWPKHLIQGRALFTANLLAQQPPIQYFDALVASVPRELRVVSVENMEPGDQVRDNVSIHEKIIQKWLKAWFEDNWNPPVMEFLPVSGYLPGNRRVLQLRISGKNGQVQDIQFVQEPNEPFLVTYAKRLFLKLLGRCVDRCGEQAGGEGTDDERFAFRVQLDLLKDLQHVRLGQHVN